MKPTSGKPRCRNCGDETSFGNRSDGERETLGFCIPCHRMWESNRHALRRSGYMPKPGPFDSRGYTVDEWLRTTP